MIMAAVVLLAFTTHEKTATQSGKTIFSTNCVRCHGADGTKGKWGAKNLKQSKLTDPALVNIISKGKGFMPSWKNTLTQDEIEAVAEYVKTLR